MQLYQRKGSRIWRKNGSGKKESAVSYGAADAKTGFMIFIFLFAVALLIRLIAAAIYKGNETDMNCFLLWSQSVFTDGLKKFYLSDSFHDYPPGYMYILYVVGAIRALFSWAWDSTGKHCSHKNACHNRRYGNGLAYI